MIKLVTIVLLLITSGDLTDIAKINKLKKNAELAYKSGQYDVAITNYTILVDSMNIEEDEIFLNLGHSYYQIGEPENAETQYKNLTTSTNNNIKSIAYQQLGFLSNDPKTLENALAYFKAALKADPTNEDARYNYELIKKKLRDQNENQSQDQNDQQNQDQNEEDKKDQEQKENDEKQDGEDQDQEQQNKEDQEGEGEENKEQQDQEQEGQEENQEQKQQDQESEEDGEKSDEQQQQEGGEKSDEQKEQEQQQGEESEEGEEGEEQQKQEQQEGEEGEEGEEKQEMSQQQQTAQKLEEMNISEEKAQMILEALKNSEVQYIQQNRRKPSQNKDSGKPDW